MPKLLAAAEGEDCTIKHPGYCNGRNDTVVAAHANWLATGKGMGMKADDFSIAFACYNCHTYLDLSRDDDRIFYFLRGHLRTLRRLWERGIIG